MGKYKLINGIMVDTSKIQTAKVAPMTIVTSPDELHDMSLEYANQTGNPIEIPIATVVAIDKYTDDLTFTNKFHQPGLNYEEMLDKLTELFSKYEVPIGLLSKLCDLSEYNINIIVDDSGSMGENTDSLKSQAYTPFMLKYFKDINATMSSNMTRFEEEEDRLHLMIDFLAYIPTGPIMVTCMNRKNSFTIIHDGKTPEQFIFEGHQNIRSMFTNRPSGGTPTMGIMKNTFLKCKGKKTAHYLFTDGCPSDCSTTDLADFLFIRNNPKENPLTFVSCTNVDSEAEWMKEIEERGPYMAEVDDYEAELKEVQHDQGPSFPYSKGLWIMCLLAGAINPYDLDAMDDSTPFTKYTLENIMGRGLTSQEYSRYWNEHPKSTSYQYSFFSTEKKHAAELIDPNNTVQNSVNSTRKSGNFMSGLFGR